MAKNVTSKGRVRDTVLSSLKLVFPKTWETQLTALKAADETPSRWTIIRAVVTLDIAAMLYMREWYRDNAPIFRYLAMDASPLRGTEFFATVERVVLQSDVQRHLSAAAMPPVLQRKLPVVILGNSRLGLAEKSQAYVHQAWLEYGPGVDSVRRANCDVRAVLTDMGTELGICDIKDIVDRSVGSSSSHLARGV